MGVLTGLAWGLGGNVVGFPRTDWELAGIGSAQELNQWLGVNVRTPNGVREWKDSGTQTSAEARFWMSLGQAPVAVVEWKKVCVPHEAGEWIRVGCSPVQAQRWRAHGVAPQEIPLWKRAGVEGRKDIVGWIAKGFKPDTAAPWLKAGVIDPAEGKNWRDAGVSPKQRAKWMIDGFSSGEALHLIACGVDRKDAQAMRSIGAPIGEISEWVASRVSQRKAKRWIEAGVTAEEYAAWTGQGGWKAFRRWSSGRASIREFAGFSAGWAASGLSHAEAAEWLAVTRDPPVAADWQELGIDAPTATRWVSVGFTRPADTVFWFRNGLPPQQAAAWTSAFRGDAAEWFKVTRGEFDAVEGWQIGGATSAAEVAAFVGALVERDRSADAYATLLQFRGHQVSSPLVAQQWVASFSVAEALDWIRAGIRTPSEAVIWSGVGFIPADLAAWLPVNMDPFESAAWRAATTDDHVEARQWQEAGVATASDVTVLRAAGVEPPEVKQWNRLGVTLPSEILRWRESWNPGDGDKWVTRLKTDLPTAWDWRQAVGGDLDGAAALLDVDHTPETAHDWTAHGFNATDSVAWRRVGCQTVAAAQRLGAAGVTVEDAGDWSAVGVGLDSILDWRTRMPFEEAAQWLEAVGSLDQVAAWEAVTNRDVAAELVRGGIDDPSEWRRWLDAGIDVAAAVVWRNAGLGPEAAMEWKAAGLTHDQASEWALITTNPVEAMDWMSVCSNESTTALAWVAADVTDPHRVLDLQAIGLTSHTHGVMHAASKKLDDYPARLREQAVRFSGLEVAADGTLLVEVEDTHRGSIPRRLDNVFAAAARAGEPMVRVRHGSPRLSAESVRQLPEARFIRGAGKAAVLNYGWQGDHGSRFELCADGAHTDFAIDVTESTEEFIHLDDVVTS